MELPKDSRRKEVWTLYQEKLEKFLENHQEEMLEDLKTLVRINSQKGEELPGKPYGEGPAEALAAAEKLLGGYGLKVTNYGNRVVTGDFGGQEKKLDILAHLDVVPVTDNWKTTKPFEPLVQGGRIYGRGTADDKGPAIAALYAIRAIKETGVPLAHGVRLILGSDEECGSSDLEYYYQREEEAPMSFSPDADFPVINLEKGRLEKTFSREMEIPEQGAAVCSLQGGTKANVVPDTAWALLRGISAAQLQEASRKLPADFSCLTEEKPEGLLVTVKGLAAHASTPEMGHNAVCALLKLLCVLPLAQSESRDTIAALAELFAPGDTTGQALGVAMEDEISGALTMNLGILSYDGKVLQGVMDFRIPVCGSDESVTDVVERQLAKYGIRTDDGRMVPPHYVPADSELVQKLLASYERYTGKKGETLAMGGGTYVHGLKNGVAFGCMSPEVDNHMHGDDEFMELDTMLMSAKIFADAIVRICG